MNALYLQILIGAGVMLGVVIAFILSIKSGQYDDLDSPAHRIIMDDDDPRIPHSTINASTDEDGSENTTDKKIES